MSEPKEVPEIYSFVQSTTSKLHDQIEIEDINEIQKLLNDIRRLSPEKIEDQYSIVAKYLKGKNHLIVLFNVLLDACYFLACIEKTDKEHEIEYMNVALDKLAKVSDKFRFTGVLNSFDSYITFRVPEVEYWGTLDLWLAIKERMENDFSYDTASLHHWLECQYIRIITNMIEKDCPEGNDGDINNLEICKLLIWMEGLISKHKIAIANLKMVTIDHALYYISKLDNQEISKEREDRINLQRIKEILDTINIVGFNDEINAENIKNKFLNMQEYFNYIENPPDKPDIKEDIICKKSDIILMNSLECLEIGTDELRQGWRIGTLPITLANAENLAGKFVNIKFYIGKNKEEVEDNRLEANVLAVLSEKKDCFLKYYGKYQENVSEKFEFAIVTEQWTKTLKSEIDYKKTIGGFFSKKEIKTLARQLIVALEFMHSFTNNSAIPELKPFSFGIFHMNICPANIAIFTSSPYNIHKLINFNAILAYKKGVQKKYLNNFCNPYMAPEVKKSCEGQRVKILRSKADVYSFGLTLLEAITLVEVGNLGRDDLMEVVMGMTNTYYRDIISLCIEEDIAKRPSFKTLKEIITNDISKDND
ncbi:hypothetical protein SteCoe_17728 [Stentor coeruleus]|uniref:Protein kinase domain-containing protein n=1 Tax=Stentor coeruleus TaxID=5963 RepID=A0A1R2BYL6_9CILI|nr:hypothetical protein SteCoe_17728 [Stentor coeruleus]